MANSASEDEIRGLIGGLLVQAGTLMGDESVDLVSRLPDDRVALEQRIARLAEISADLGAFAAAAEALRRKSDHGTE
jgi:hypothetical protein